MHDEAAVLVARLQEITESLQQTQDVLERIRLQQAALDVRAELDGRDV